MSQSRGRPKSISATVSLGPATVAPEVAEAFELLRAATGTAKSALLREVVLAGLAAFAAVGPGIDVHIAATTYRKSSDTDRQPV